MERLIEATVNFYFVKCKFEKNAQICIDYQSNTNDNLKNYLNILKLVLEKYNIQIINLCYQSQAYDRNKCSYSTQKIRFSERLFQNSDKLGKFLEQIVVKHQLYHVKNIDFIVQVLLFNNQQPSRNICIKEDNFKNVNQSLQAIMNQQNQSLNQILQDLDQDNKEIPRRKYKKKSQYQDDEDEIDLKDSTPYQNQATLYQQEEISQIFNRQIESAQDETQTDQQNQSEPRIMDLQKENEELKAQNQKINSLEQIVQNQQIQIDQLENQNKIFLGELQKLKEMLSSQKYDSDDKQK